MSDRKRILFVDDEPRMLEGLKRMLFGFRHSWDIKLALSADEALRMADERPFDVIVADVKMPGKDGFALLEALQKDPRSCDIPVIMLTGADQHDLKRRALDAGASDLLNKPVVLEDLIARINNALRVRAYQEDLKAYNDELERRVEQRTKELKMSRLDMIWRLAKAGEYRDEETGNHVVRVGCYCRILAQQMSLPRDFVEMIFLAAPLHDIGKIGVPDRVLLKPGQLDPDEQQIMEDHCRIGADILLHEPRGMKPFLEWMEQDRPLEPLTTENPLLQMAATIALTHHERWDGTGYPRGLKGEQIPIEGRIVSMADVFDSLCTRRPYKPAYSESKALAIIDEEAGGHFDPEVYHAFRMTLDQLRAVRIEYADPVYAMA